MTLYTTGMCWCLWSVMPEPLPTYNRFQNFLYRRRAGVKPWLHRTGIAIFAINLAIGITIRFAHGHHGDLTGQGENPPELGNNRICGAYSRDEALAVACEGRTMNLSRPRRVFLLLPRLHEKLLLWKSNCCPNIPWLRP